MFHQEDVGILFPHLVKKPIVRDLKPGADGVTIKVPKLGQYHIVVKKEGYVTHKENVTVTCLPNCTLGKPWKKVGNFTFKSDPPKEWGKIFWGNLYFFPWKYPKVFKKWDYSSVQNSATFPTLLLKSSKKVVFLSEISSK